MISKYHFLYTLVATSFLVNVVVFNTLQPQPYMDEELHMEQAKSYCKGNLSSYDPRISTPPGLYLWPWLLSILTRTLAVPGLDSFICNTLFLRLISSCFAILLWFQLKKWSQLSRPRINSIQLLALWSHPILFFYYFFYYTDIPSLYFGLQCLLSSYESSPVQAALFATLSTIHRQTGSMYHLISCLILTSRLWCRKSEMQSTSIVSFLRKLLESFFDDPVAYCRLCWPHFICFIGYALWLTQRGTVAIGHARHHRLTFHPTMMLYFLCYELLLYPPSVFSVAKFCRNIRRFPLYWQLMSITFFISLRYYVYLHPFLLSDRRHYTFLFVRLVFQKTKYLKYALIPCGLLSLFCMEEKLRNLEVLEQTYARFLIYFPIMFIPLLELRYFVPNHIIIHLVHLVFASSKLEEKRKGKQDSNSYTVNTVESDDIAFYRCLWNFFCFVFLFVVFYFFPLNYWRRDDQGMRSIVLGDGNHSLERMMP